MPIIHAVRVITMINAHGAFTTSPTAFDLVMDTYLPASVNSLRDIVTEMLNAGPYNDIVSVTEFLMMIAHHEYPATQTMFPVPF